MSNGFKGTGFTASELMRLRYEMKKGRTGVILPVKGGYISQGVTPSHIAVDFAVSAGTPIVAPVSGIVSSVQDLTTGYGRHVRLMTPAGEELIFGHMQNILVKLGQKITAGMQLGTVGSTGSSTGAHLHFERRVKGQAVDPWEMLKGAIEPNYDAMRYGISSGQQSLLSKLPETGITLVRRTKKVKSPKSSKTVRSVAPSKNFSVISGASTEGEAETTKKETLPQQVVSAMSEPFERVAVGGIGVVLMITGLFILSSGLREQTIKLGKEATKIIAGTATGGVGGAVVGAVA